MMLSFYVQPFTLVLRKELLLPTHKRLKKVSLLGVGIECILYIVFSCIVYFCFGDNRIPDLIITRDDYPGKNQFSKIFFISIICIFFLLNNLGLSNYNPGIRAYLG